MKLKKLLKEIPVRAIKGPKDVEVTGVCANSKLVAPGNLFVAKKGREYDGARFIPQAVAAGAVAILTDIYDPFLQDVTQIIHPNVAEIEAEVAAQYYGFPTRSLFTVGVTGTNGKTTTTYLVKQLLDALKVPCGLIGTVEWIVGKSTLPSSQTTPDAITNQRLLSEMVKNGCRAVAMEVSSHGLDQGRVREIDFDIAIFTNLTLDHLDYHQNMERYQEAKAKLFSSLGKKRKKPAPAYALINADDPYGKAMVQNCQAVILTYGIDRPADLMATQIKLSEKGMQFQVEYRGVKVSFSSGLIGRFNVYNCLAAIGVGLIKGYRLEQLSEVFPSLKKVPGRLERVENGAGLNVFVDYAHTDDALKNVLQTLQEVKKGRLITVFGCGGDRDQSKRPKMGAVGEALSDVAIVTSDNPRGEEPGAIVRQVLQGFKNPTSAIVEVDRKLAIHRAIRLATPEDIVLIAGKGHEPYQIIGSKTIEFDDRVVVAQACNAE